MAPIVFRGGWLPTPDHLKVELTPHLRAISVPSSVDYYSGVNWKGYLGNDQLGDCTCAADGHIVCQQTALGDGSEVTVTTDETITVYEASGYVPGDSSTDNGWTVQAALDYLRTRGWPNLGWRIAAYGTVDVSNFSAIRQAVFEFGALSIGFNVPQSAMDQFNAGQPWTPVAGSADIGGHCVPVVGYDLDWVYVVTWGRVQRMSWSFWTRYVTEAHAVIARDWLSKSGQVSLTAFGAEFAALFGGSNPFAGPQPPTPTPTPPQPSGCLPSWLGRLLTRGNR